MRLTTLLNAAVLTASAVTRVASNAACTCECCGVRPAQAWETHSACSLVAVQAECTAPVCSTDAKQSTDYAQFCFDGCTPDADTCVLVQSLDHALPEEVSGVVSHLGEPPATSPQARADMQADERADANLREEAAVRAQASLRRAPKETGALRAAPRKAALLRQSPAEPSPTQLQLAKAAMLEAKVHAKAAGAAARRAKESYELAMRSSREMAEYAGKLVYAEIQREAGEQAKKALKIRNDYVKAAQEAGIANAKAASAPYKKGAQTAVNTAGMWNLRAGEFASAAGALKSQATAMAGDAQKYTETEDYSDAEMYSRQAHQLVAQSQEMAGRADAAHKQANDIQSSLNWYALAGRGAAASALAGSMPYDVAPPPLPATVFL